MTAREAFQRKVETKIKKLGAKIEARVRTKYCDQVEELRAKREAVDKKLDELKSSGAEKWGQLRTNLEMARNEINRASRRGASIFKRSRGETSEQARLKREEEPERNREPAREE